MNREIKFRGFQKSWIYGGITIFENQANIFDVNCVANSSYEVDINSVGQFTGLLDKNGTEIYEGDIVSWKETRFHTQKQIENNIPMPKIYKSIVYYEDGGFIVSSDQEKDTPLCCFFNDSIDNKFDYKAEVIGNIYENPELLHGSVVA